MKEIIHFENEEQVRAFLGPSDRTLRHLRKALGISLHMRGTSLTLEGDDKELATGIAIARKIMSVASARETVSLEEVDSVISEYSENAASADSEALSVFQRGKFIVPKTAGQRKLVRGLLDNTVTFGIGPAGTGKTYLSVATAVSFLKQGLIRRIVLVRPAVEAGEKLGFLPGDLREKVDPYLRPLYDSLGDMLEPDQLTRLMASDVIEVAPLAFMRGRTLNRSFVILDEAQNCTVAQMKMFLTRLGYNSKAAVTGDVTQSDLPPNEMSGLLHAYNILRNIPDIKFVVLGHRDIVRHPLVQRIVDAYEKKGSKRVSEQVEELMKEGEL